MGCKVERDCLITHSTLDLSTGKETVGHTERVACNRSMPRSKFSPRPRAYPRPREGQVMRNAFILIGLLLGGCAAHNATGPMVDADAGPDGGTDPNVTLLFGDTNGDGIVDDRDDADGGVEQDGAIDGSDAAAASADGSVPSSAADGSVDASVPAEADAGPDAGPVVLNVCGGVGVVMCSNGGTEANCPIGDVCASSFLPANLRCPTGQTYDGSASNKWMCGGPNDIVCPACKK